MKGSQIEEIEPRILYAADVGVAWTGLPVPVPDPGACVRVLTEEVPGQQAAACLAIRSHEIAFVDGSLPDREALIDGLELDQGDGRDLEIVVLRADADGLSQIDRILAQRQDIAAVHIITHGASGAVRLGNVTLDGHAVQARAQAFADWGRALEPGADILIYGCNVGASEPGRELMEQLALLTGADVAASDDATGDSAHGGDWRLEVHSGAIETLALSANLNWAHTLDLSAGAAETLVNQVTANNEQTTASGRQIASDSSGNFVVVWSDASSPEVYGRLYNASGTALGGAFQVNTFTANTQNEATVARNDAGDFVVVWTSNSQDGAQGGIYAQRFNAAGVAQGAEIQINETTASDQHDAAVAMDSSGNFVVTWTSDQAGHDDVWARRFDASGSALAGEFRINSSTTNNYSNSAIAMRPGGAFVVVWQFDNGSDWDVYSRVYNSSGVAQTAESRVNSSTSGSHYAPDVAMRSNGDFVVSWTLNFLGLTGIEARTFDSDGSASSGDLLLEQAVLKQQSASAIDMDSSGNFIVTWDSDSQDNGSTAGVYARQFSRSGNALSDEVLINSTTAGDQNFSSVTWVAGEATVLWSGQGAGDSDGVFFRQLATTIPGITVSAVSGNTSESGTTATFTVVLDTQPLHNVVIAVSSSDTTEGSVSTGSLTFTSANWSTPQTVTITGVPDVIADGDQTYTITLGTASSSDDDYDGINPSNPSLTNLDVANTAPVLDTGPTPVLTAQQEDAGAPSGVVGTLVSALVDLVGGGGLNNVTDGDFGALAGIAVIAADTTHGTWWYSKNNGSTWLAMGGVTANSARLLAADANTRVYFEPSADYNGSIAAVLTIRAWDQIPASNGNLADTTTNGGTTQFSVATDTVSITVSAVNDIPAATDDSYAGQQEATLTVGAGSGVLANDSDPEGDALSVLDHTDPANGTLTLGADGSLIYTGNPAFSGTDTFDYLVRDSGDGRTNYWGLAGNVTDAIGSSSGSISGATTVSGQFGQALQFNGTSHYASIPDTTYSNEFALSFWFKVPSNAGVAYQYFYDHGSVGAANSIAVYMIEESEPGPGAGQLRTRFRDSNDSDDLTGLDVDVSTYGLADGAWHYYTLTTQSGVGARVYLDGVLRASNSNGGDAINPTGAIKIGARSDLDSSRFLAGSMDSLQLHGRTLQSSEVTALYGSAAQGTVSLNITPNTAPVITSDGGGATASLSVAENSFAVTMASATDADAPAQTLTYGISGTDASLFTINSATGELRFTAAPNREAPLDSNGDNIYQVTLSVSDGAATDTQALSITVTDVDEFDVGAVTDSSATANSVAENAPNGTLVGITAHASDADATLNTITYSLDNDAGGRFSINGSTGVVSVAGTSLLDYESATSHTIVVRATSADASFSTQSFVIALAPVNDNLPVFTSSATPSVAENNTTVLTLTATDADLPSQTLSYSITGGVDQARFHLSGGQLLFNVAPAYASPADADANNVYLVQVTASDSQGGSTVQSISVTVTNVNDAPVISAPSSVSTDTGVALAFPTNIDVQDVDAGSASIQVALTALHGSLTLGSTSNLAFSIGDGSDDASMTFTGNLTDIAAALHGLVFTPEAAFVGTASIGIAVDDLGNSGSGTALTASHTVSISVNATITTAPSTTTTVIVAPITLPSSNSGGDPAAVTSSGDTASSTGSVAISGQSAAVMISPASDATSQDAGADTAPLTYLLQAPARPVAHRAGFLMASAEGLVLVSRPAAGPTTDAVITDLSVNTGERSSAASQDADNLRSTLRNEAWLGELRRLQEEVQESVRFEGAVMGTTAFVSGGLSVGYVIWMVRGGVLASTLLSSLPAWQTVDPLPVLGRLGESDRDVEGNDPIEALFGRARARFGRGRLHSIIESLKSSRLGARALVARQGARQ